MDTKFWGPSGWKFLHSLTFSYEPGQKKEMLEWLETLPYILPCKFCRASLTDYYAVDMPSKALENSNTLSRWLYRIHGRVNDKLRDQGQKLPADPTFSEVRATYEHALAPQPRQCESFPGWDFLFSVAYNHPLSVKGSAMPNVPPDAYKGDAATKNRWNILPPAARMKWWRRFWVLLPAVMPAAWRDAWTGANSAKQRARLESRQSTVAWLWRIRCGFSHGADPYRTVCSRLASYESGCSTSTRAKTCRRRVKAVKHTKRLRK